MTYSTLVRAFLLAFFLLTVPVSIVRADDAATTSTPAVAHLTIRDGDMIATSSIVTIPLDATSTEIIPTGAAAPITTSAQSVLAALETLAAHSTEFSISDLQYYPSYGAFYLNCLLIPAATSTPLCGQWQYAVNGATPGASMDSYTLGDQDTVFLYFGYPRSVAIDTASVTTGVPFTVTAQSYDPTTNSYHPAEGLVVGITQANPADLWSPTVVATSTSDAAGEATFTLAQAGDYAAGLEADYYTPATTFSVAASAPVPVPSGGGGGIISPSGDSAAALAYLLSQQQPNGSLTGNFIDEWAALAFAGGGAPPPAQTALRTSLASTQQFSSITDYERRAMALEALGENPYNSINPIQHIVASFDGVQIGDPSLINDDIFSMFPLLAAGRIPSDALIQQEVRYILSRQSTSGAWESVDLTAAAIQALAPLTTIDGITAAIAKARAYLVSQEQPSGCFGNSYTTSWVLQAIASLGETPTQWTTSNGSTPRSCLAALQQPDGGFETQATDAQDRIWATSYAVLGLAGKPWATILHTFPETTTQGSSTSFGGTSAPTPLQQSATISTASTTQQIAAATTTEPTLAHATTTLSATPTPLPTEPLATTKPIRANNTVRTPTLREVQNIPPATLLLAGAAAATERPVAAHPSSAVEDFFSSLWHHFVSIFGL